MPHSNSRRTKAGLFNYITALFDPNVGINKDGYLVNQNGYLDFVGNSTDYLDYSNIGNEFPGSVQEDIPDVSVQDPVSSAQKITANNNAAGQAAVNNANNVNQATTEDAYNKYLQSLEFLNAQNISSAEKIMQMNEQAQINAYNRNLSYIDEYYPRLVKSLRSAGINPVLMASRGFGTPGGVSSAAQIAAPYVSSPSQLTGFASQVAQLDFNTMRDVLTQVLGDMTDLKESELHAAATVLSSLITALGRSDAASIMAAN